MAEESRTRKDIEQDMIVKALKDGAYRQRLKADPKAALEEAIGLSLPAELNVSVLEESPSNLYLVLPPPVPTGTELSDDQLDAAAGGVITFGVTGVSVSVDIPDKLL